VIGDLKVSNERLFGSDRAYVTIFSFCSNEAFVKCLGKPVGKSSDLI